MQAQSLTCFYSCGTLLWADFDTSYPDALQELLEELHHVPRPIDVTHQSRKAYLRVYINHSKTTGRLSTGTQDRIPVAAVWRDKNP